jgi:hypothetical protein
MLEIVVDEDGDAKYQVSNEDWAKDEYEGNSASRGPVARKTINRLFEARNFHSRQGSNLLTKHPHKKTRLVCGTRHPVEHH